MANRDQFKAQDFINAMPGSGGIIATIAKRVGCDWHTAKKYISEYRTVADAYADECETVNDLAVSKIIEAINEGDIATAKWWIARKRKDEFSERAEVTGAGGGPVIVVRWDDDTDTN